MRLILLTIITILFCLTTGRAQNMLSLKEKGTVPVKEEIERPELQKMLIKYGHSSSYSKEDEQLKAKVNGVTINIECMAGVIECGVYYIPDDRSSMATTAFRLNHDYELVDITSDEIAIRIRNIILTSGGVTTKYIINQLRLLAANSKSAINAIDEYN